MPQILITDDNDFMRAAMALLLEKNGYSVIQAANGPEGMKQIQDCAPDLLITDIVMPEGDGLELIFGLRQSRPRLPVIAFSGASQAEVYLDAAVLLGAKILPKPFNGEQLLATVRSVLEPQASGSS